MKQNIIIHARNAPCKGVWVRDTVLFLLSWSLWCAMVIRLTHTIGRDGTATVAWLLHRVETGLSCFVIPVSGLFGIFLTIAMVSSICSKEARLRRTLGQAESGALRLDVASQYFGLDIEQLNRMQAEKCIWICHTHDGHIADIRSVETRFQ